jgi:glycerol-3-phosphate O-acyltransferase
MNNHENPVRPNPSKNALYSFFARSTPKATETLLNHLPTADSEEVTPQSVYKEGSLSARRASNPVVAELILPGSKIIHGEHIAASWKLAQEGKAVLVLSEHFSNFDLTNITYLADHDPLIGEEFVNKLIAMAGVKLSTASDRFISAYIQIYNRIVIIPSRTLESLSPAARDAYNKEMGPINMAALKELAKRKVSGHPILVFPTGTRTRPGQPETAKAVKEMYSYVRSFDYIQFISLNGINMHVAPVMSDDEPVPNVIMMGAAPTMSSQEFLDKAKASLPEGGDMREHVATCIMSELHALHDMVEPIRLQVPGAH